MMKWTKTFVLILLGFNLTFTAPMPWANGQSKAENLQFYLVTFGPGDDIPSYWGHIAILVEDTLRQQSAIYNYGLYSFDNDFLLRFIKGRLIFEVGRASVASYFNYYRNEKRSIRLLKLNIPLNKRLYLAEKLEWNILPQNKKYLYHHYYDNCATRLRDLIDQAVDGQFHKTMDAPATMTLRDHTKRYTSRNLPLEWILMFWMSDRIDQPIKKWDEMFLPDVLEQYVQEVTYTDSSGQPQALAGIPTYWFKADRPPVPQTVPHDEWPTLIIASILAAVVLLASWRQRRRPFRWFTLVFSLYNFLIGLFLGLVGSVLFFVMFFTEHDVTFGNENLFLAHPLSLGIAVLAIFLASEKNWAWRGLKYLWSLQLVGALLLIVLKIILPSFDQDNFMAFCLILPIDVSMVVSFYLLRQMKYHSTD